MGLAEAWGITPEPEESLSLAEEAALHAPALWEPAHVEPEGVSGPLPLDFPVEDPIPYSKGASTLLAHLHTQRCHTRDCSLDDPEVLAEKTAEIAVEAMGVLQVVASILFAHGEVLLAESLTVGLDALVSDLFRPYFERNGLTVGDDYEV